MTILYKPLLALTILAAVAGCQSRPRPQFTSEPVKNAANAVNIKGQWRATEGPLLATFSGKDFTSINTENNQVVAAGAYRVRSAQDIQLDWVGALSGRSSAKCRLVNIDLMNCTPTNGSGFQLRRV